MTQHKSLQVQNKPALQEQGLVVWQPADLLLFEGGLQAHGFGVGGVGEDRSARHSTVEGQRADLRAT